MRKARDAKAEDDTVEMARTWAEAKVEKKVDIDRVNAKARERERAEAKERVREKANTVQRAVVEARRGI